jgi:hypothetical protein
MEKSCKVCVILTKRQFYYILNILTFQSLAVTLRTTSFNIKKFYEVLASRLCVLYGSQNKQRLFPYTLFTNRFL